MIEQLNTIKSSLISQVQSQMGKLDCVDAKELGEVIDMVKDLEEAIYYCTITKAMNKKEEEPDMYYYTERMRKPYYRDMDREAGRMYYDSPTGYQVNSSKSTPMMSRDSREGQSPISRRNYMETKQIHGDKATQMRELEKYLQELSSDITEMISDSSTEEKQLIQNKLMNLASRIGG